MYDKGVEDILQSIYRYGRALEELNKQRLKIGEMEQTFAIALSPYVLEKVGDLTSRGERQVLEGPVLRECSLLLSGKVSLDLWRVTLWYLVRHGKLIQSIEYDPRQDEYIFYHLP